MDSGPNSLSIKIIVGSLLLVLLIVVGVNYFGRNDRLSYQFTNQIYPIDYLEPYRNAPERLAELASLPFAQQLDSLFFWTNIVRNLDEDAALAYAQRAAKLARENGHTAGQAYSAYYLGLMRGRTSLVGEDLEIPLTNARISHRLFERTGNEEWTLRSLALIGALYQNKRQYDSTDYYLAQALDLLDRVELDPIVEHSLRGEIYHLKSTIKSRQDSLELADRMRELAKAEYAISNDRSALGRLEFSHAVQEYRSGHISRADSLMAEVLVNLQSGNDRYGLYYALERLGYQKFREGIVNNDTLLIQSSQDYFREAITLQPEKSYSALKYLGMAYQGMASAGSYNYRQTGLDSAIIYYHQSMQNAREVGAMAAFQQTTGTLAILCDYLQRQNQSCDSLLPSPLLTLINDNYAGALATITDRLTEANRNLMSFEMEQQDQLAARKRLNLTYGGLGVLAIVGLIFFSIFQRQQRRQVEERMATLRAQINPHFMSNSLNAIESLVNFGDRKDAAKYLIHFSRLTRRVLNNSMVPTTTLASELDTMKHFLALEQLRLGDRLTYSIDVAEGLDSERISIPSMILQPYIENAIWHGIKPKSGPGHIEIYCEREDKNLICSIEDDGIGRDAAGELKKASLLKQNSVGMKITQERIEAAGRGQDSGVRIIDLKGPDGEALGTRVLIQLPFKTVKTASV